jgi:hypothetical protein
MSYYKVRRLPLPTDIQNIILEYLCTYRAVWSRWWLKLSLKHIRILDPERRVNKNVPFHFYNALYSVNANIGRVGWEDVDNKQNCIEEFQDNYDILPLESIFSENLNLQIPVFRD